MNKRSLFTPVGRAIAGAVLLCTLSESTLADVKRVWNNQPITLTIPVNSEIRVIFPVPVDIQVPADISEKLVSTAPNQEIVYWKATEAFDRKRIVATATDNSQVYLVDLVAAADGAKDNVIIEDAKVAAAETKQQAQVSAREQQEDSEVLQDPAEIVLTRFASQSLYAPARLVPTSTSIHALTDVRMTPDFPLLQSQDGEQYRYQVVGAWQGYGHYITAVLIKNKSPLSVAVNPNLVRGNFTHVTAQHLTLGPVGSLEDRTTLYLISDKPFVEAIAEDGYGY